MKKINSGVKKSMIKSYTMDYFAKSTSVNDFAKSTSVNDFAKSTSINDFAKSTSINDFAKSTSICDLPPEILFRIFSLYVESEGSAKLYTILAKVSMSWQKIAFTPSFGAEMSFTTNDFNHGLSWLKNKDFLLQLPLLKTLNFKNYFSIGEYGNLALIKIMKSSTNLENFNLEYSHGTLVSPFLINLPTFCPKITGIQLVMLHINYIPPDHLLYRWVEKYNVNLTRLIIRGVYFRRYSLTLLVQKIAECCPNMTNFELDMAIRTTSFDMNSLQAGCPKIKKLCLKNVVFRNDDDPSSCFLHLEKFCFKPHEKNAQKEIICVLRKSKELKELELIGINTNSKTMLQLPCRFLRKLRFQHHDDADDLYLILCQWKHTLTELDVSCDEKSVDSLFCYIEEYGKDYLESLTLRISSVRREQLKDIVRQCTKLKSLCLNKISDTLQEKIELTTRRKIREWLNC